jgi:Domain of unknown function (DUF1906)
VERIINLAAAILLAVLTSQGSSQSQAEKSVAYLGFDRNDYPGDDNLNALRQTFSYSGYWLNNPPGEMRNTWVGKRKALDAAGFGFLVLFNGRLYADLKSVARATALGKSDAKAAIATARKEGFPPHTVIFLDQEQGGRMLPEQKAYLFTWIDAVVAAGFDAGVYCSGIPAKEDGDVTVVTASDLRQNAGSRKIVYWVTNDACPPSPGCAFSAQGLPPGKSALDFADVWQFAQSPKRKDVAAGCPANYNPDGECYPPGVDPARHLHVDVNTATSADPSRGRSR